MTTAALVWSGAATALALLGVAIALRPTGSLVFRYAAAAAFAMLAGLVVAPLVAHGLTEIWPFYLPVMLVFWAALPRALATAATAFIDPEVKVRVGWSALPAIMALALALLIWVLPQTLRNALLIVGEVPNGSTLGAVVGIVAFALVLITTLVWVDGILRTLVGLRAYHRHLRDLYSNADQFEVRWLGLFVALPGIFALAIVLLVLNDNLWGLPNPNAATVVAGSTGLIFLLLLWLCYASRPAKIEATDVAPKYARAPLSEEQAERINERLEQAMTRGTAFLDPLLSLQSLARQIGVPANQLSRFLNERSGLSFFDYVNRSRARHARDLMLEEGCSVLDAAFASGFNSKSTYYKAFRREFGTSPATCLQNYDKRDPTGPDNAAVS